MRHLRAKVLRNSDYIITSDCAWKKAEKKNLNVNQKCQ